MKDSQRVTFSPGEFAALFGKSQTWGYRQIYAGKVKAITEYGRILIPASEVDRILKSAGRYEGLEKAAASKAEIAKLKPQLQSAWQDFIGKKRVGARSKIHVPRRLPKGVTLDASHQTALARVATRTAKNQ